EYYKSRIATGDLPEVIMTWGLTNFLADGGNLLPLPDSYYGKFGIPLPTPYKGKRYTSQAGLQIQGIVINKKMWNDIGVTEPPRSWDELVAALQKLKDKGYQPLVYGGREWSASQPLFYAMASDLYERVTEPSGPSWTIRRDRGQVRFTAEPLIKTILQNMIYLVDNFVEKGALSDGYNEEQRDFYGGKGATWMMGCWIGGDIEPNRAEFEMEYWPVPSMIGRPPVFIETSRLPNGWAMTTSATDEKYQKSLAVLEAFYEPAVYQAFLNGESQFKVATKVNIEGPQSDWAPAQRLYDNMAANMAKYGVTLGYHLSLDDLPPPIIVSSLARVMQEILAGNRDLDQLCKMLDDDWDGGRKAM
ncbi:MAG: extracellular solute-binding protein, partial [Candidatus Hydrogenedentes bacterium]|nr:extracellular solute-binding protein [Candidatus Hydrogenedentota bacterium]